MGYIDDKVSSITGLDITDETNQAYLLDWVKDSIREIYSILPKTEKYKYAQKHSAIQASIGRSVTEPILSVLWKKESTDDDSSTYVCREIPYNQVFQANKYHNILKPSETDPVFYLEPQSAGIEQKVKALPAGGYINVITLDMTDANIDVDGSGSVINVPNEIDHIIVLLVAIKATNFLLQSEQDDDIYVPLLSSLRADYQQALQMYLSQFRIQPPQTTAPSTQQRPRATAEELQSLIQKYN